MHIRCCNIKALLLCMWLPCVVCPQSFPDLKFFPVHAATPWPTKKINHQLIDQQGLAWFTTESSGLLRYDGNIIRQCISPDSITSTMHELSVDKNGWLYISAGEGLIRYDPLTGNTKRYRHNDKDTGSLADDDKPNPFVDSKNRVWVTGKGLQQLDVATGKFISYQTPALPGGLPTHEYNRLENMAEDQHVNIWIASAYGLYKADTVNRKLIPYYHGHYSWVTGILIDNDQQFWISTWGSGVMKFDPVSGKFTTISLPDTKWNIALGICEYTDINDKRWICFPGSESLILLDPVTTKCRSYLTGRSIRSFYADKDNRLWLSTNDGIFVVNNTQQQITVYPLFQQTHQSEDDFGLPRFWFEYDNEIWLCNYFGKGIRSFTQDLKFISHRPAIPPSANNDYARVISYILKDKNHHTWYCTDSGLVKQTGNNYTVCLPENGFVAGRGTSFRNIIQRADGKWWIRSVWRSMYIFDPDKEQFVKQYMLPGAGALSASIVDKQGRLWVGTDKGLYFFDEAQEAFIAFPLHNPDLAGDKLLNYIRDLLVEDDNRIWLATYSGVAVFDIDKKQFSFPEANKVLGFSPSFRLLQDDSKNIWVVAEEKLVAYNPATGQAKSFRSEIGLPSGFDRLGVFRKSGDGNIWLAYNGGVCSFNPAKLLAADGSNDGSIFVTDVYEDAARKAYQDAHIEISSGVSNIRINFAYTNYSIPEQNALYFKLYEDEKNAENEMWQSSSGEINFVDLSPGRYQLSLKGENKTLSIPPVTVTYLLVVSPQWYQTFLFKTIMLLMAAGVVYLLVKMRVRNIRAKALIKQKIAETEMAALKAQMNPHFMFNCINSIDAFIYSNDKYNATLYLNKFAKLLRNILDHSRENTVLLSKDVDTLKMYIELEELRHEGKFRTVFNVEPELLCSDLRVPPLIIQPFAENAILHGLKNKAGNDGILTIDIQRRNDNIMYTITDNGIGREAAGKMATNMASSYGMEMSFERIRLFNEEEKPSVEITDRMDNGIVSGTIVKVLLKEKYLDS
ncbi:MAG: histidine kinase [Terrimonas sp.]|nr:histidine kinase [Terrimonas sp.]